MTRTRCSHRQFGGFRPYRGRRACGLLVAGFLAKGGDSCTLADAVETMRAEKVSLLLVDGRSGIVTERDLARAMAAGSAPGDPIEQAVDPHPRVVPAATTVVAAAALMLNEQLGHLLVDLGSCGLGVVFIHDVMAVLLQVADPHLWLTSLQIGIDSPSEIWLG